MIKISKKQIDLAEVIICQQVKDLYAQQEAFVQLHRQIKLINNAGINNPWFKDGEPAITFFVNGRLNVQLGKAVSEALGL